MSIMKKTKEKQILNLSIKTKDLSVIHKDLRIKYLILTEDYKNNTISQQFGIIIELSKQILIVFIILFLRIFPFLQTVLIIIIQICYIIIIILKKKPYISKIMAINALGSEIILTLAFLFAMILSILDILDDSNIEIRILLGSLIIFLNIALISWIFIILFIRLILEIKERRRMKKNRINPI